MAALTDTFRSFSVRRMEFCEREIDRCLERLTEAQMLARNGDHENSIANLLMHLEGNLRQWFLHGIDNQPDVRTRDAEFSLTPTRSTAEIRARFTGTLAECRGVISTVPDDRLLESIHPQPNGPWPPMPILEAVMMIIGHLQMHTGQIILLTKQLAGTDLDLSMPRKR